MRIRPTGDATDLRDGDTGRRNHDLFDLEAGARGNALGLEARVDGVKGLVTLEGGAERRTPEDVVRERAVVAIGVVSIDALLEIVDQLLHGQACCFRRSRYRGVERTHAAGQYTVAACHLVRR